MVADLSKFIDKMNDKGKELFDLYMKLKATFEDLTMRFVYTTFVLFLESNFLTSLF